MSNYGTAIDKKWQKKWEETELYKFNPNKEGEKLYVLEMFSYPSGSQLHAGHVMNGTTASGLSTRKLTRTRTRLSMYMKCTQVLGENTRTAIYSAIAVSYTHLRAVFACAYASYFWSLMFG